MAVFVVSFAFALTASLVWDTKLTWWGFILCVIMGVVMILPVGKPYYYFSTKIMTVSNVLPQVSFRLSPANRLALTSSPNSLLDTCFQEDLLR